MDRSSRDDLPLGARLLPGVDLRLWLLIVIVLAVAIVAGAWATA